MAKRAARQLRDAIIRNDPNIERLAAAAAARVEETSFGGDPEYPGIIDLNYGIAEDLSIMWYPHLARDDIDVFAAHVEEVCGPLGVTLLAYSVDTAKDIFDWGSGQRVLDGWLDEHPSPKDDVIYADEWDTIADQAEVSIAAIVTMFAHIAALTHTARDTAETRQRPSAPPADSDDSAM